MKQAIINKNFPNQLFDTTFRKFIENNYLKIKEIQPKITIKFYNIYQISNYTRLDEKIVKYII